MQTKRHASKKVLVSILALFALVFTAFTAAHATTIVETASIPYTGTDWSNSLSFGLFNSSLGTLTGVTLVLTSDLSTVITVTNGDTSPSTGSAYTYVVTTVTGSGITIAPLTNVSPPTPAGIWSTAYNYSLAAGANSTSGTLTGTATSNNSYTSGLSAFTGVGDLTLPASVVAHTALYNTGGNSTESQVTNADLYGTLTYTYTPAPVPLPSALLLLGPGLFGLAGLRRKFKG
jgi:hypothetical protein